MLLRKEQADVVAEAFFSTILANTNSKGMQSPSHNLVAPKGVPASYFTTNFFKSSRAISSNQTPTSCSTTSFETTFPTRLFTQIPTSNGSCHVSSHEKLVWTVFDTDRFKQISKFLHTEHKHKGSLDPFDAALRQIFTSETAATLTELEGQLVSHTIEKSLPGRGNTLFGNSAGGLRKGFVQHIFKEWRDHAERYDFPIEIVLTRSAYGWVRHWLESKEVPKVELEKGEDPSGIALPSTNTTISVRMAASEGAFGKSITIETKSITLDKFLASPDGADVLYRGINLARRTLLLRHGMAVKHGSGPGDLISGKALYFTSSRRYAAMWSLLRSAPSTNWFQDIDEVNNHTGSSYIHVVQIRRPTLSFLDTQSTKRPAKGHQDLSWLQLNLKAAETQAYMSNNWLATQDKEILNSPPRALAANDAPVHLPPYDWIEGPLRVRDSGRIEKGDNVFADEVKWRNRQIERDNVLQYACCTEEAAQRTSDIVIYDIEVKRSLDKKKKCK